MPSRNEPGSRPRRPRRPKQPRQVAQASEPRPEQSMKVLRLAQRTLVETLHPTEYIRTALESLPAGTPVRDVVTHTANEGFLVTLFWSTRDGGATWMRHQAFGTIETEA